MQDGVVVPKKNTRKKVFTTLSLDNIDQRKKSKLSKNEFHGTLISITNHLSRENHGELREPLCLSGIDFSTQPGLPLSYAAVASTELDAAEVGLSCAKLPVRPHHHRINGAKVIAQAWVDQDSDLNSADLRSGIT